jgi:hypothetical protein
MNSAHRRTSVSLVALLALAACDAGPDAHGHGNDAEVITTLALSFAPMGGGTPVLALFNDPDGDGGMAGTTDPITLMAGTHDLSVKFENRLQTPSVDITVEVKDEGDEHQVFFTGKAVSGPASNEPAAPLAHSYLDMDVKGLPIGLSNRIVAKAGSGPLVVTLRHMPPLNDKPVKTAMAADTVKVSGIGALGGSTDAQVTFAVTVR